ncbi:MAG TPA: glycosyltransferase 87 family protein, partial [Candidatus Baltobacteraceae bacterium]|nr:glycosyltransferase 87 family protein [Candidatus Baltobacteraceae bacterium]
AQLAVDVRQPLIVATYWQHFGATASAVLLCALLIAGIFYAVTLLDAWKGRPLQLGGICLVSAFACAAALAFPVVFSSDVYAYAAYGSMVLHGIDPYAHAWLSVRDPLLDAALWQWGNPLPACVYGPAFVALAALIVAVFSPLGAAAPLLALRICSCIALVLCAPSAYALLSRRSERLGLSAAVGIALNPVAIWSCAEGHNDAIALACALAAISLAVRGKTFLGSLLVPAAALIKLPALAIAAVFALYARSRATLRAPVTSGLAWGAACALVLCIPLLEAFTHGIARSGRYQPAFSLQAALGFVMPMPAAAGLTLLLCAGAAYAGLRSLYRGQVAGCALVALAAWSAIPNPYPWYSIWTLPTAFLAEDLVTASAVIAVGFIACTRYYAEATTLAAPALSVTLSLAQGVPLIVVIIARMFRARRARLESRTAAPDFAPLHFP